MPTVIDSLQAMAKKLLTAKIGTPSSVTTGRLKLETLESREVPAVLVADPTNTVPFPIPQGPPIPPVSKWIAVTNGNEISVVDPSMGNGLVYGVSPFGIPSTGTVADFNGDGTPDLLAGAGPGGGPHIRLINGAAFIPSAAIGVRPPENIFSFYAFDKGFTGGVSVAAADVNGDGTLDIIAGAGPGAGPHVKVFDGRTGTELMSFYAFDKGFTGGVTVAGGDLDDDGRADVVVGAGPGAGPHVKVFNGRFGTDMFSFYAFDADYRGGVSVATADFDNSGKPDIVTGAGPGHSPMVRVYVGVELDIETVDANGNLFGKKTLVGLRKFADATIGDPSNRRGVTVVTRDVNADGRLDIVAATSNGSKTDLYAIDSKDVLEGTIPAGKVVKVYPKS